MKIIPCIQYSPEWWEARRGIPTASNFHKLISLADHSLKVKGSTSYICDLIADTVSLNPNFFSENNRPVSPDVQRGKETEAEARKWFEMEVNEDVQQVGFITTDDGTFGCSPDGLVGGNAGLELKCPNPKTQVKYLLTPKFVPKEYVPQVHGSMLVTGCDRWWFCSYCPGFDPILILTQRDEYTLKLEAVLKQFLPLYREQLAKVQVQQLPPPRPSETEF